MNLSIPSIIPGDPPPKSTYRPEIDGLRAFAIIAVIINHFDKDLLPSGYLGVDIFFVISGYVITSSLISRKYKNLGDFLLGFYSRRVKRILPALVLCVVITSILICLFNPAPRISIITGISALFGFSNLYLLQQSTDYFAASTELNVFTQTWSLGVEEQFYFVFPFLVWFTGFGRKTNNGAKIFGWIVGSLAVASLITFIHLNNINQPTAYFLMPTRFWELGSGSLLFLGSKGLSDLASDLLARVSPLAGIVLLVATLFIPLRFAIEATIAVILLTTFLIASVRPQTTAYRLLTHPLAVYIGLISYSLYLWHWSVLSISRWTIGIYWWSIPIQIILMLLLAIASYRYVEKPLRSIEWAPLRWKSISYGVGIAAIAATTLITMGKFSKKISLDNIFPSTLSSTLEKSKKLGKKIDSSCHFLHRVSMLDMERCLPSKDSGKKDAKQARVLVFGDSHANQYVNSLKQVLTKEDVFEFTIAWGCGYISKNDISEKVSQRINCSDYIDLVNNFIDNNLHDGDIIILGLRWRNVRNHTYNFDAWNLLTKKVTSKGGKLILVGDSGELGVDSPLQCEKRWWRPSVPITCFKKIDSIKSDQSGLDSIARQISEKNTGFYYVLTRHLYCDTSGLCGPSLGSLEIYSDGSHLSEKASLIGAVQIKLTISDIQSRKTSMQ
jgi:peptidoglycan/LPS O-acetylase OafA/YrhL